MLLHFQIRSWMDGYLDVWQTACITAIFFNPGFQLSIFAQLVTGDLCTTPGFLAFCLQPLERTVKFGCHLEQLLCKTVQFGMRQYQGRGATPGCGHCHFLKSGASRSGKGFTFVLSWGLIVWKQAKIKISRDECAILWFLVLFLLLKLKYKINGTLHLSSATNQTFNNHFCGNLVAKQTGCNQNTDRLLPREQHTVILPAASVAKKC